MIGELIEGRYEVVDKLGEGGMSLVYRAEDIETGQMVALKFLKEAITSRRVEDVLRFQREARAIAKLAHSGIVKIYGAGEYKQTPYIVMELLQGKSLADLFREGKRFSVEETVEIVLQISEVLNYVHGKGIIHRDLKPGNIMLLWQAASQQPPSSKYQVKVLDFGLAQVLELTEIKSEEEIVGTFGYMSPEQSGIVRKAVDERSDLYSLGIIFYELLTGELPFKGKDVGTILHQQVARKPSSPKKIKPEIPEVIEEMVLKLLNKEPEERYQTAKGLLADLTKFLAGEVSFMIGKEDVLKKLTYRTRLIGREEELNRLKELFEQARQGKGGVCLVSGGPGIGKSRLIEEMRGYIYERGGIFISGKCFAQENKIPYQPFKDALNEYMNSLQGVKAGEKQETIRKMKGVLGELGQIIIKFNPNMRDVLGEQPELIPLEPERENKRFLMVSSRFFCNLGEEDKPCVIFLDDLQWADEGSLSLLTEIVSEIKEFPILVLGAYRDSEVTEEHSLIKLRNEARDKSYSLQEINIGLFDHVRLNRLIAELLLEDEERTYDLSLYILNKSRGNPFFSIEIARQLVDEKALFYKEEERHWQVDWEKVDKVTISPNIVDIVLRRIETLEEDQVNLLSYAAVIGREFEVALLFRLSDLAKERVIVLVDEAISLQLIERSLERGKILFVHDRIKDAFYQRIGEGKKRELHLEIARTIEGLHKENIEEVLFDLAHHYTEAQDREKSLQYALPAAEKAKGGYANEDAVRYYSIGINILEDKGHKGSPEWIKAKEGLTTVCLTTGKNDEAIEIAHQVLPLKETPIEKARVYRQIGTAYFKKGDWKNCEDTIAEGLALLGEKIPRTKTQVISSLIRELSFHILHCLFPKFLLRKEGKLIKPEYLEISLSYLPLNWMYILTDVWKFTCSILRMLNLSEARIGKSKELGMSLGGYASLCMAIPLFKRAIKYHQKALNMRRELQDGWGIAQSLQWMGYCYSWKGDYQKSIELFEQAKDKFQRMGDMWELEMVINGLAVGYYYKGNYSEALDYFYQYLEISKKIKDDFGIASSRDGILLACTEKGEFAKAEEEGNKALEFSEENEIWFVNCTAHADFGDFLLERGKWDEAIKHLEKAKKLYEENTFLKDYTVRVYPFLTQAYIEKFKVESSEFKVGEQKPELDKIKTLCKETLKQTKSWVNYYGAALMVNARYYALVGKKKRAERFFLTSIEQTKSLGRRYELARGYYEYGNFLKTQNREEEAKNNWQQAYDMFREIGAQVYMKRTADLLGIVLEEVGEKVEELETAQKRLRIEQELMSLIKVSQYLSSILNLDDLLERIMDSAIEVVGAERGFLMLYQGIAEGKRIDEATKGNLVVMVARNADKESLDSEAFQASRTVIARVEKTHKFSIITDATSDEELRTQPSVVKYNLRSILCVPIITRKDEMLGIIYLDNRLISGLFTQKDLDLLETLGTQAGISIENAILVENEKEMTRKVSEAEARVRYTDILEKQKRKLEIAYQEKDQAYEELKATQAQLIQSEKMATIGRLAGGVAHEINTPLATILTNTEMLMLEGQDIGYQRDYLEMIKKSSLRCKAIVEQLLKYSRLPGSEFEMVDVGQVIDECYLLIERQLADEGIRVNREYGLMPKIKGNANELRQVFTNVILNARDAIKKTLADRKRQGEIRIRAYQEGRSLVVEVQDDGCGIRPEDISKIFDPFFTTKDVGGGTGLGLYVSHRIIERHRGKIEARSKIGQGTTIRVELPLEKERMKG